MLKKKMVRVWWVFVFLRAFVAKKIKCTVRDFKCHKDTKAQRFTKGEFHMFPSVDAWNVDEKNYSGYN